MPPTGEIPVSSLNHEKADLCQWFFLLFRHFFHFSRTAKPPLSSPFHPHSFVERLSLGASWVYSFSKCCHLIIDLYSPLSRGTLLFSCIRSKPGQSSVPANLTLASDFSLGFIANWVRAECCVDPLRPPRLPGPSDHLGLAILSARTKTEDKKRESQHKSTRSDEVIDIPAMLLRPPVVRKGCRRPFGDPVIDRYGSNE